MTKRIFKVFLNSLTNQERWLNEMAANGYHLVSTSLFFYDFEPCEANEYDYQVQFVADKTLQQLNEYKQFLGELNIRSYSKNINIGKISLGSLKWRPYVSPLGMFATSPGMINKELLILKKKRSAQPFAIYTTPDELIHYFKHIRRALMLLNIVLLCAVIFSLNWI